MRAYPEFGAVQRYVRGIRGTADNIAIGRAYATPQEFHEACNAAREFDARHFAPSFRLTNPARFLFCLVLMLAGLAMFFAVWPMLAELNLQPVTPQSLFFAFVLLTPGMLFIGAGTAFSWTIR